MTLPAENIRDFYAKDILLKDLRKLTAPRDSPWHEGLPEPRTHLPRGPNDPITVGIIGAGAAGLYAALIIDSLQSADISYDILDANPSRRTGGGRLYTYKFSEGRENDYFDIGAMRFPDIPFMKPVFKLIRDDPKSPIVGIIKPKIISYVLDNGNNLNFFNSIIKTDKELQHSGNDPFETGINPPDTVRNMTREAIGSFVEEIRKDLQTGWEYLMQYDSHSTRSYMRLVNPKYSNILINYLETFNTGTNLFDQALTETVMDTVTFDYADDVKWYCIHGGAGQIADAMASKLARPVQYGKRVIKITVEGEEEREFAQILVSGEQDPHRYSHVISTVPFSCFRNIDTTGCHLDWNTQTAIRSLHYDSSVKVAIKFSKRWWETTNPPHLGGVSSTDRPTRVVVYPSYGVNQPDMGATMIVSYTWAQDAQRVGSLARGPNSEGEDLMLRIIIRDLADMHRVSFNELWDMKLAHKVYDWNADINSAGAFALFGAGQFESLYPHVTRPIAGVLHFAGEATSIHHAWVVGAFNSAWRSVFEILRHESRLDLIEKMLILWPMPGEFDRKLIDHGVALGQHLLKKHK